MWNLKIKTSKHNNKRDTLTDNREQTSAYHWGEGRRGKIEVGG